MVSAERCGSEAAAQRAGRGGAPARPKKGRRAEDKEKEDNGNVRGAAGFNTRAERREGANLNRAGPNPMQQRTSTFST